MDLFKNLFKTSANPECRHRHLRFIENFSALHADPVKMRSLWFCEDCHELVYTDEKYDLGNYSDGYHTFNELYHHRAVLFAVLCYNYKILCWKSKKHHDGSMYDGMFIVGVDTPNGQATYHYDIEPYWDMFNVEELDQAPEYDGHTPEDAINRIQALLNAEPGCILNIDTQMRMITERDL